MPSRDAISADLLSYVVAHADLPAGTGAASDLLDAGLLDSLLVMDLVLHAEETHGVTLAPADLLPENFRSLDRLADLIVSRLPGDARAA